MTTHSQTFARNHLRDAPGAVLLLDARFRQGPIAAGSADATAAADAQALITALNTAVAAFQAGKGWDQDASSYTLTWSTSGSNDATTKAQLINWLSVTAGHFGSSNQDALPNLGADLLALFNQF